MDKYMLFGEESTEQVFRHSSVVGWLLLLKTVHVLQYPCAIFRTRSCHTLVKTIITPNVRCHIPQVMRSSWTRAVRSTGRTPAAVSPPSLSIYTRLNDHVVHENIGIANWAPLDIPASATGVAILTTKTTANIYIYIVYYTVRKPFAAHAGLSGSVLVYEKIMQTRPRFRRRDRLPFRDAAMKDELSPQPRVFPCGQTRDSASRIRLESLHRLDSSFCSCCTNII